MKHENQNLVTAAAQLRRYLDDIHLEIPEEYRRKITREDAERYLLIVQRERHHIWNKKYWGLKIHESICAVACPIDNNINRIDKLIHLL